MHIVIPIETKSREFEAKIWLSGLLACSHHRVTLGELKIIKENIYKINPDIYIGDSAVDRPGRRRRFQQLNKKGTKVFVLDTEGGAFGSKESFTRRVAPDILKYVDTYLAWGKRSAELAKKTVDNHNLSTKVVLVGNPRFDLLQPDMTSLYTDEVNHIQREYGDFILVNTNFGFNHVDIKRREANMVKSKKEVIEGNKNKIRLFSEFISLICELNNKQSKYNIIIRPHPNEDAQTYQTLLSPFKQVKISKSGEVRPWILASELVIHNSCTTGLEAGLMRQPVLSYLTRFYDGHPSNKIGYTANNPAEVIKCINQLDEKTADIDEEYIQEYIFNTNIKSAKHICDVVSDKETNRKFSYPSFSDCSSINEILGMSVYKFSPSIYRLIRNSKYTPNYWTYTTYKCGVISIDEIENKLKQFTAWYDRSVLVKPYKHTDNLFMIQPSDM